MFLWENSTFGELVIYYEKFSIKGREKLKEIQREFDWSIEQLDWLIACIGFESQFKPRARNKISKATGLIQFMPLTAEYLGTTIDALLEMEDYEQLEYVKRYYIRSIFPRKVRCPFTGSPNKIADSGSVYCCAVYGG